MYTQINRTCSGARVLSLRMHARRTQCEHHEHEVFKNLQVKGVADAGSAAVRVSGMELGGLFGSLLAGRLSDFLVRKFPNDGAVGKRVQVRQFAICRPVCNPTEVRLL